MKVRFGGVLEKKSGGCIPCGARRASKKVMVMRKSYRFPSGSEITFHAGRVTEVSDKDGTWLLDSYPDAFEEVK